MTFCHEIPTSECEWKQILQFIAREFVVGFQLFHTLLQKVLHVISLIPLLYQINNFPLKDTLLKVLFQTKQFVCTIFGTIGQNINCNFSSELEQSLLKCDESQNPEKKKLY